MPVAGLNISAEANAARARLVATISDAGAAGCQDVAVGEQHHREVLPGGDEGAGGGPEYAGAHLRGWTPQRMTGQWVV